MDKQTTKQKRCKGNNSQHFRMHETDPLALRKKQTQRFLCRIFTFNNPNQRLMIAPKFFHDESRVRVLIDGGLEETTRIYNHFKSRLDIVSAEINFFAQIATITIDTDYDKFNEIKDELTNLLQDGKPTSKD